MIKKFTYPLPDELYVEGVSGKINGTFTYDGPETFDVHIDTLGNIIDIDVQNDPEFGPDYRKTIDASKQVEVAYMLHHYFHEKNKWEYLYEDETMENGDIYKKPINPDLNDAYELKFNFEKNDWELIQNIKTQENPATIEAKVRKEYINKYSTKYAFSDEVELEIEKYISDLNTFIENNPPLKLWKYINFNFNLVPKLPVTISIEIAKLPSEGV